MAHDLYMYIVYVAPLLFFCIDVIMYVVLFLCFVCSPFIGGNKSINQSINSVLCSYDSCVETLHSICSEHTLSACTRTQCPRPTLHAPVTVLILRKTFTSNLPGIPSVHFTDISFYDGPGMLIPKTAKPCINSMWIALLIHGFVLVKTRLLIACDTAFYAIICVKLKRQWNSDHYCFFWITCIGRDIQLYRKMRNANESPSF